MTDWQQDAVGPLDEQKQEPPAHDARWVAGHDAGYVKGRDDGIQIGYGDAKLRAYLAVGALRWPASERDVTNALAQLLGRQG